MKTKREIIVNNKMFFVIIYVEIAYSKGHLICYFYSCYFSRMALIVSREWLGWGYNNQLI